MKVRTALLYLTFFLIFASPPSAGAETFFVRPAGGDYGLENGTSYANAWDGFTKISWGSGSEVGKVDAGDTLYICGTHRESLNVGSSGASGKVITVRGDFRSDPGILDGALEQCIRFDRKNHLTFYGLTVKNSRTGLASYHGCNNITVDNCKFSDHFLKGLHLYSTDASYYVENISIRNCSFKNIGRWGNTGANSLTLGKYARSSIIEDCYFSGNGLDKGVDGVLLANGSGGGSNHVIRRCTFVGHEENAIDLKHVVQSAANEGRTKIYDNDLSGSSQLEIVMHLGTQGIDIFRNKFHDGNLAIGVVRHDTSRNDNGDLFIAYNLFDGFASGILMDAYDEGIGSNAFLNNTCYDSGAANNSNYSIQIATNNWTIKNNIFHGVSKGKSPFCSIRFLATVDMGTVALDHNSHFLYEGHLAYRWPDDTYRTVGQAEKSGIEADPQFSDAPGGDFTLKRSSPCLGAGVTITNLPTTSDAKGEPISPLSAPNIGAYGMALASQLSAPKGLILHPPN
ncbi:MAG: right-handed parallel beta-helix repeat-containing protein [Thermodesulfobacteriota bacterium]|nr:right-handed parallel beta-helix repeat-containing protein [Thermodesulfobacteriota bacterium]